MSIDVIGDLYRDDAEYGPEGDVIKAPTKRDGFHVNVTPDEVNENRAPFVVNPPVLIRVWSGDDPADPKITVPLRFASEAEWLECSGS